MTTFEDNVQHGIKGFMKSRKQDYITSRKVFHEQTKESDLWFTSEQVMFTNEIDSTNNNTHYLYP